MVNKNSITAWCTLCCILLFFHAGAQNPDTLVKSRQKQFLGNIFQQAVSSLTDSRKDTAQSAAALNARSEDPFLPYAGKIIRHIIIRELGFEKTFTDTSKSISYFGTRILNSLHINTKPWVIRNNLFIRERQPLNAYKTADNERYLRTLSFIQDARILVEPVAGSPDSVDLMVVTKDLFSITGDLSDLSMERVQAGVADDNLLGMGQRLQFTGLRDQGRDPLFGYAFLYSKSNIGGSFINATLGYTLINSGISLGKENETSSYVQLDLPLVSPYSLFAGGFQLSHNYSENVFHKPDSLFYDYAYNVYDGWAGYNIGTRKLLESNNSIRDRRFLALRYMKDKFFQKPYQIGENYDPVYNDKQALLAQLTFFRQDFYKTNYIYGFGTTEDVPYGYNVAVTAGWYKQLDLKRPYAGIDANRYIVTDKGDFIQYFLRTGSFLEKGKLQDAGVLLGANIYSRLFLFNTFKIRQYLQASYSRLFNRVTYMPLKINNPYGLEYFNSDSITGAQRISLYAETFLFTSYKLLGFKFAPFAFGNFSLLTPEHENFSRSDLYTGIGGGLRTRNENLAFGTIELRLIYFPRKTIFSNQFQLTLNADIRFRFSRTYVKAPDFIQLNTAE